MSGRIDCSVMSHHDCLPVADEDGGSVEETAATQPAAGNGESARYDCVNECLSSLGLPATVAGTAVAVGCVIVWGGACAALAGGELGALVGACDAGCDQLERSES